MIAGMSGNLGGLTMTPGAIFPGQAKTWDRMGPLDGGAANNDCEVDGVGDYLRGQVFSGAPGFVASDHGGAVGYSRSGVIPRKAAFNSPWSIADTASFSGEEPHENNSPWRILTPSLGADPFDTLPKKVETSGFIFDVDGDVGSDLGKMSTHASSRTSVTSAGDFPDMSPTSQDAPAEDLAPLTLEEELKLADVELKRQQAQLLKAQQKYLEVMTKQSQLMQTQMPGPAGLPNWCPPIADLPYGEQLGCMEHWGHMYDGSAANNAAFAMPSYPYTYPAPLQGWSQGEQFQLPQEAAMQRRDSCETQTVEKWQSDKHAKEAEAFTTLMLRNLPNNYKREQVWELLDHFGFKGKYNFVYVPFDWKRSTPTNKGFGFVNFRKHEYALEAWTPPFAGFSCWKGVQSSKKIEFHWASKSQQGYEVNVERYQNSPMMHAGVDDEFKPAVFDESGALAAFKPPSKKIRQPRQRGGGLPHAQAHQV